MTKSFTSRHASLLLRVWRSDEKGCPEWYGEIVETDGCCMRRFVELDELVCLLIELLDGGSDDKVYETEKLNWNRFQP